VIATLVDLAGPTTRWTDPERRGAVGEALRDPAAQRRAQRYGHALHGHHRALTHVDSADALQQPGHQRRHRHVLQASADAVEDPHREHAPPQVWITLAAICPRGVSARKVSNSTHQCPRTRIRRIANSGASTIVAWTTVTVMQANCRL
jgi:hypothetical protein